MEVGPENGDKEKKTLWENRLYICDMFFDPYFEKIVPENIKSVIYNACKINPNLKDSIWIPMDYKSEKFTIGLQWIDNAIKTLEKDCNKKVILLSNNSIPVLEKNNIVSEWCISILDYFLQLEMYPCFRFLTFADCNDKNNIKSLYTENDRFTDGKLSEVEVLLSDKFALKKTIYYCLEQLTKFDEFSFDYEYNEDNSDELTKTLKELCRLFNARFPWFFNAPDELIKFLKYQIPRLITKSDKHEIEKILRPVKFDIENIRFEDEYNADHEKFTLRNNYEDVILSLKLQIEDFFLPKTPKKIKYNQLPKNIKGIIKYIKDKFPNYFHSYEEVVYYIEWLLSKTKGIERLYENDIFCDIDWTLVVNNHLNKKVVDKLLSYYNEWKKIRLWTAWNINKKKILLDGLLEEFYGFWLDETKLHNMWLLVDFKWKTFQNHVRKIENKYDFEWLKPEIVIDDWCYKRFLYQINATPKSFINVNDL